MHKTFTDVFTFAYQNIISIFQKHKITCENRKWGIEKIERNELKFVIKLNELQQFLEHTQKHEILDNTQRHKK